MPIFEDKTVVITGGTGSLGRTIVHRVLGSELGTPRKVIVFSRDETKQHQMRMDYMHKLVVTDDIIYRNFMNVLEFRIGDIRSYNDVCSVLRDADVVVNAAALK
jgi:UDP-glucose 4-epimerase